MVAVLACALLALVRAAGSAASHTRKRHLERRFAYVTLLYHTPDTTRAVFGVEALGRSLQRYSNTTNADRIALVATNVPKASVARAERAGWTVVVVEASGNPNPDSAFAPRLRYVFTKLEVFNLVDYERVLYLDADTLVRADIGSAFGCPAEFCAVMRHSELVNTGVFVAAPSASRHAAMAAAAVDTPSYTGGDQGFLNSWYDDFSSCPFYEPRFADTDAGDAAASLERCARLPARFNGDWPLLFSRGRMAEAAVMHYSLGAAKPWDWWARAFFPGIAEWDSMSGAHGLKLSRRGARRIMLWATAAAVPPALLAAVAFGARFRRRRRGQAYRAPPQALVAALALAAAWCPRFARRRRPGAPAAAAGRLELQTRSQTMPELLNPYSLRSCVRHVFAGFVSLIAAFVASLAVVPADAPSVAGWVVYLSSSFSLFFACEGRYLWVTRRSAERMLPRQRLAAAQLHGALSASAPAAADPPAAAAACVPGATTKAAAAVEKWGNGDVDVATETFFFAIGFVALVTLFTTWCPVLDLDCLAEVVPRVLGAFSSILVFSAAAFVRLPVLWHEHGCYHGGGAAALFRNRSPSPGTEPVEGLV